MNSDANGTSNGNVLLEAIGISKSYSDVPVLKGVSFALSSGEIVGFVGHNGAGKSTLMKVFSGAHQADSGTLKLAGKPVSFTSPSDAIQAGISTVYQELSLLQNLTVTQNVWLGRELRGPTGLRSREMREKAQALVDEFGLSIDVDRRVSDYPVATRQMLEIAIAASRDTKCLLLDEPTTALEGEQISELMTYLRGLADNKGLGILLVNHKLDELYGVADRIVALMDGRIVIDADVESVNRTEVVAAIAGDETILEESEQTRVSDKERVVAFAAEGLTNNKLKNVSFTAAEGRILGIYGLGGSGRSETLRAIAGADKLDHGSVVVGDVKFVPSNPKKSMKHGIAFLTEERKTDGISPQMDSILNVGLPVLDRFSRVGVTDKRKLREYAKGILDDLKLKGDPAAPISSLSGGNQQKVLLARALAQEPDVLLLDEPTKGVDIGVKREIHTILSKLAHDEGLVVVMVSSEEEEILEVADEVLVFSGGKPSSDYLPVAELSVAGLRRLAWSGAEDNKNINRESEEK